MKRLISFRRHRAVWPIIAAVLVLLATTAAFSYDRLKLGRHGEDLPPTIDFTWTPLGPTDLKSFQGYLRLRDDYALDFTTYRFRLVELDRIIDLPIEGLIGKEYESPINLGWLADKPETWELNRLTVEITVADDKGQETKLERVIRLQLPPGTMLLQAE